MFLRVILVVLAFAITSPAFGQALSVDYRRLLAEAAVSQSEDAFAETANLVARVAPGGPASVMQALEDINPHLLELSDNRFVVAEPDFHLGTRLEVPVIVDSDASAPIAKMASGVQNDFSFLPPVAGWSGRLSAGLRVDSGNSDQQDYSLGLDVERDLAEWGFTAGLDYAYSESGGATSRDQLALDARGERSLGDRWSLFLGGEYDQDQLSSFDYTAFLSAGAAYRPALSEDKEWVLRAGPGIRYLVPVVGQSESQFALDLGSEFSWQITDTSRFTSDTTVLVAESARAEQTFAFITALSEAWAVEASWRYIHEFEPLPGFEEGDSRFDISIVREF